MCIDAIGIISFEKLPKENYASFNLIEFGSHLTSETKVDKLFRNKLYKENTSTNDNIKNLLESIILRDPIEIWPMEIVLDCYFQSIN